MWIDLVEPTANEESKVEGVLGIDIPDHSGLVGTYVSELGLPHGAVVSLIVRGSAVLAIDEHARIRRGDRLVLVATAEARAGAEERLRAVARGGRLATWLRPDIGRSEIGRSEINPGRPIKNISRRMAFSPIIRK